MYSLKDDGLYGSEVGVISPPSAPCPSIRSTPWPWQSPSAFALHLRRWRSDGRDTFCSTSTLRVGDTTTQVAAKAPWAHGVIPTLYDDSFIRASLFCECGGNMLCAHGEEMIINHIKKSTGLYFISAAMWYLKGKRRDFARAVLT